MALARQGKVPIVLLEHHDNQERNTGGKIDSRSGARSERACA
jgi:hypothetical protein